MSGKGKKACEVLTNIVDFDIIISKKFRKTNFSKTITQKRAEFSRNER